MCLNRLPPTSLKNARLVCKRWSSFIIERRLLRMKNEGRYQNLWLFVFGTLQYSSELVLGHNVNKIHALDLSRNEWHDIDASFLKGRFMFSIAGIRDGIFIVGGRTNNKKSKDDSCFIRPVKKTHKDVMFFNPVTKSCRKIHSMKYARCVPILGVTENPIIPFVRRRSSHSDSSSKGIKKGSFLLIVVGGFDDWSGTDDDSLMYCGEMYDSLTKKWTEIQSLPSDFGSPYSGIVCGKMFYVVSRTYKLAAYDIEKGFWFEIQTPSFAPNNKPPYEPKLVSSNGRILLVSNRWPAIRKEIHNLVTTLWELDLMHLTWTEISIEPDVITDWRYIEFVANKNMIFGVMMPYVDSDEILDDFIACDVSESNRAKWINISSKVVHNFRELYWHPKCDPFWTRSMAVIHVSI
ncbi:hypothetical protein TSUD_119970 [Trifolium subterraneum]|uniref:F-box domain-containing protein n=1 Tax=Trifolium subterraneum TaxID=3900 RepID=A0A2Z6N5B0_TRISU|nr:hypothetical protein TSUD_119970 [Trifolium subterraneum]